jgi:hypothetical protein
VEYRSELDAALSRADALEKDLQEARKQAEANAVRVRELEVQLERWQAHVPDRRIRRGGSPKRISLGMSSFRTVTLESAHDADGTLGWFVSDGELQRQKDKERRDAKVAVAISFGFLLFLLLVLLLRKI